MSEVYDCSSVRGDVVVGVSSELWSEKAFGVEKAHDPGITSHVDVKAGF